MPAWLSACVALVVAVVPIGGTVLIERRRLTTLERIVRIMNAAGDGSEVHSVLAPVAQSIAERAAASLMRGPNRRPYLVVVWLVLYVGGWALVLWGLAAASWPVGGRVALAVVGLGSVVSVLVWMNRLTDADGYLRLDKRRGAWR